MTEYRKMRMEDLYDVYPYTWSSIPTRVAKTLDNESNSRVVVSYKLDREPNGEKELDKKFMLSPTDAIELGKRLIQTGEYLKSTNEYFQPEPF